MASDVQRKPPGIFLNGEGGCSGVQRRSSGTWIQEARRHQRRRPRRKRIKRSRPEESKRARQSTRRWHGERARPRRARRHSRFNLNTAFTITKKVTLLYDVSSFAATLLGYVCIGNNSLPVSGIRTAFFVHTHQINSKKKIPHRFAPFYLVI